MMKESRLQRDVCQHLADYQHLVIEGNRLEENRTRDALENPAENDTAKVLHPAEAVWSLFRGRPGKD